MNVAALIETLEADGVSAETILRAIKAGTKKADNTNAERQARHRAKRKDAKDNARYSNGVTPPNDIDILTPREVPEANASVTLEPRRNGKHRLPADWEPKPFTPGTLAEQTVQRWQPGRMERELSKFRDHHTAAGTKWENWQAAWSKWVNNSKDFERVANVATVGKSQAAYAMLNCDPNEPF